MKRKIMAYAVAPAVLGFGLLGANIASAHGLFAGFNNLTPIEIATKQSALFQNEATLLGISIDKVKEGWSQGKTLQQIAADNGVTADQLKQKMQDNRAAQMKSALQTLVSQGVITQAQADARLAFMQTRMQNASKGNGRGHGMRGMRGAEL